MGCTARKKHIRKTRSTRPEPDHSTIPTTNTDENSRKGNSRLNLMNYYIGLEALNKHLSSVPNLNLYLNPGCGDGGRGCPRSVSVSNGCGTVAGAGAGAGAGAEVPAKESQFAKNQDVLNSVMNKFLNLDLDENILERLTLDPKDEMVLSLIHQINDLEKHAKERKKWAQDKAMQAARKLSTDFTELKVLRTESQRRRLKKKGKQTTLEDSTIKSLSAEMENAMRKADRANAAVRKLETENAEIRAKMKASKLIASESLTTCLEVAKRDKRYRNRVLAGETKMHKDIAAEEQKILVLQQELAEVEAATKEAEVKWRQEQKAKELFLEQLEEARQLKQASKSKNKIWLQALHLRTERDFQPHKDDLQRLNQEYAHLKDSTQSTETEHPSDDIWTENSNVVKPEGETIARLLDELDLLEDSLGKQVGCDRECMICMKDEVSVVFLPCAHQVICANCNENYSEKGGAVCPYCHIPIEQRIRAYGASL